MPCPVPSGEQQPSCPLALCKGCPCRATTTPSPSHLTLPKAPAQQCMDGSGTAPSPQPLPGPGSWPCGQSCVPWSVPLAVAGVTFGGRCAPSPAPAMYQGHFPEQLCPRGAHQGTEGFLSCLTPRLLRPPCHGPGADGSPLSPGAAVSSREGRGKPPSVASELPGPGGAASDGSSPSGHGWILTRGANGPSGWTGTGGPGRTGSPSAPRAGGERGLPKLLVLSSATRGRLLEPSPTSLKFLRPSNRKKEKEKNPQRHLL